MLNFETLLGLRVTILINIESTLSEINCIVMPETVALYFFYKQIRLFKHFPIYFSFKRRSPLGTPVLDWTPQFVKYRCYK